MKKLKSSLANMVAVLVSVAVIMGGLLALVNHITTEPIKTQEQKILSDGINSVMGGNRNTKISATDSIFKIIEGKKSNFVVYHIATDDNPNVGVAIESSVNGFGGTLKVLVGFDNDANILGYSILQTAETPGLGSKADTWFGHGGKGNVIGRNMISAKQLRVKNDGGDVDAITASTITSRAFLQAVNQAYSVFEDMTSNKVD
ncbi:MAG: RnfABCDGE type electron transport complex subunit G [Prevotella sp.]